MVNGTQPPDLDAIYDAALSQLGGPVEVETPQLGRVSFPRPAELYTMLNLIRMLQTQAAGVSSSGVIVAVYNRGLGCPTRSY